MCDFCRNPSSSYEQDVGNHCRLLYKLMAHAAGQDVKLTCEYCTGLQKILVHIEKRVLALNSDVTYLLRYFKIKTTCFHCL